jgi:hypothetical protein
MRSDELTISDGKMAKNVLVKLVRRDPKGVSKMASLLSSSPAGVKESASRFQNLYKQFPLMRAL